MRQRVALVAFLVVAASASADTGVGIIIGDPTGISLLLENRVAVGAAWDLDSYVHLHGDVWLANRDLVEPIDWYVGIGGKVLLFTEAGGRPFSDQPEAVLALGVRVPVGAQWYPIPELELFLEAAPGIFIFPATDFDVDLGLGVRYHF